MRNESKTKNTFPHPSVLFRLIFTPNSSTPGKSGNGGCVQLMMLLLCCTGLLTPFTCSRVGSFPWNSPSCTSPVGVLPMGCTFSIKPARTPAPVWAPLHKLQVLPGICKSLTYSFLQGASTSSGVGCRWISAPPWTPVCCRAQLPHQGLQENLCSDPLSSFFPSFLADMGVCRAATLPFCHSYLPLKYVTTEVLSWLWKAQLWTALGLSWRWLELTLSNIQVASGVTSQVPLPLPPLVLKPCT